MDIKEMYNKIMDKCNKYRCCEECPLIYKPCTVRDDYNIVKEHYNLMYSEKGDKNMNENYAMIDGEKIELNEEMIKVIRKNIINYKEYNIGNIRIEPNWHSKGYIHDSKNFGDGAIFIEECRENKDQSISITHEELPKVIDALSEINNYLVVQEYLKEDGKMT